MKFQGDILIFFYFIQVFVFTTNHHLNFDGNLTMRQCTGSNSQSISQKFAYWLQLLLLEAKNCTAHQCLPLRRKFMKCSINSPALSLLMKHLVIGQRLKTPNFSAFHWSPHGSLVSIGQNFVTTRVVHLPKRTETSLTTESDRFGPIR